MAGKAEYHYLKIIAIIFYKVILNMFKYATLSPKIIAILKHKNTEPAFSGQYHDAILKGSYLCRGCGAVLFRGDSQFHSACGWPSFDDELPGAIKRCADPDGHRTEIVCAQCEGHLGHVFVGEHFTPKNLRHCVNALAIEFVEDTQVTATDEAIVAGGCFWGVQYLLDQLPGVLFTEVGYTGGTTQYPTYSQVCSHVTGHVEAVRIIFDTQRISYEQVIRYFFEIHDPTQSDGQGPDHGSQYLSVIFYLNDRQKNIAQHCIDALKNKHYLIATTLEPAVLFWPAEKDHQQYYEKTKHIPYCHRWTKRF